MKNTDHHKAFIENPQALAVFTGPHTYVSASWYSNKKSGSTWNYMSVHVTGEMHFMSNEELVEFMRRFTLKFEGDNHESPTIYDNLPEAYLNKMMTGIVGFEIKAEHIESVFKLSQDKDEDTYLNIISHLEQQGANGSLIAKEMKKRKDQLFPPKMS